MQKSRFKRILSIAFATVMMAGIITFTPCCVSEVQAAPAAAKDINLGTAGLVNAGSKVYFGSDTNKNLWRVLDASTGLLFSDDIIAERRFDDASNDWASSELYTWLNGDTYKIDSSKFSALEQGAIAANANGDMRLLTKDEAQACAEDKIAANSWWCLRSPGNDKLLATLVIGDGEFYSVGNNADIDAGVRPVFNLNSASILFSSVGSADKSSFASVGTDNVGTNTWKLTLADPAKSVVVTNGESVTQSDRTVTVPYTYTGNDVSQISIMITDKARTESDAQILYYGALDTELATTGTGTFTLPDGLSDGYKIYMMAEAVNGDKATDYSSLPKEINPEVTAVAIKGTAELKFGGMSGGVFTETSKAFAYGRDVVIRARYLVDNQPVEGLQATITFDGKPVSARWSDADKCYYATVTRPDKNKYPASVSFEATDTYEAATASGIVDVWNKLITASMIAPISDVVETGSPIEPKVNVTWLGVTLVEGKDYSLSYKNNTKPAASTDVDAPTVTVTGIGNFSSAVDVTFTIKAEEVKDKGTAEVACGTMSDNIFAEPANGAFTYGDDVVVRAKYLAGGQSIEGLQATITFDGKPVSARWSDADKCYYATITKPDASVHTASVRFAANDSYDEATAEGETTVAPKMIVENMINKIDDVVETVNPVEPKPVVKYMGETLVEDKDYKLTYKNNTKPAASTDVDAPTVTVTGIDNYSGAVDVTFTIKAKEPSPAPTAVSFQYRTGIQGSTTWQDWKNSGEESGSVGKGLRMEGLQIKMENAPYEGSIRYQAQIEKIGWQDWKYDGQTAGFAPKKTGGARLESIKIELTGEMADHYDVWYHMHTQRFGWMGWAKNGEAAGTVGYSFRVEAVEVLILPKGSTPSTPTTITTPDANMLSFVRAESYDNKKWQGPKGEGDVSGTRAQKKTALKIGLSQSGIPEEYRGSGVSGITYRVYQNGKWSAWKSNDQEAGNRNGAAIQGLQVKLTGKMAQDYDVYYRVEVRNSSSAYWMNWAKNGAAAGWNGKNLEQVSIAIVKKGNPAPPTAENNPKQRWVLERYPVDNDKAGSF